MKKPIICIDRDGTLIHDTREHLFLGRDNDWQQKVEILPRAVEGLQLLNTIPDAAIYMITNQGGVAISDFPLLTEDRAHLVCLYVLEKLEEQGALIHDYFLCPHATPEYVASRPGYKFHPHLVHECTCLKPDLGMVFNALNAEGITADKADIYVIGDRASDVQTALNINGTGILIPFVNEPEEEAKVKKLKNQEQIHIVDDMYAAAKFIHSRLTG
ncbi:MAG: HAD hydrolase-like protein [Desulfobulbaceae bacterium]|nr:HAD hydrolase-like protein [Desulfobulbaceae bacterium]